jgi:hypothetical protein
MPGLKVTTVAIQIIAQDHGVTMGLVIDKGTIVMSLSVKVSHHSVKEKG